MKVKVLPPEKVVIVIIKYFA